MWNNSSLYITNKILFHAFERSELESKSTISKSKILLFKIQNLDCHQTQYKITNINHYMYVHVYFKANIYK